MTLMLSICMLASYAEIISCRARELAIATVSYGKYTWSDWYPCRVDIYIDTTSDVVYIDSKEPQKYVILEDKGSVIKSDGSKIKTLKIIDQDYDRGELRLRQERNGNIQIYIDFADVAWVYSRIIELQQYTECVQIGRWLRGQALWQYVGSIPTLPTNEK